MDSVDKSAFYIYVFSRNKMARLGKGYSKKYEIKELKLSSSLMCGSTLKSLFLKDILKIVRFVN